MSTAIGATSKMEFSMNSEQMDVQADKVSYKAPLLLKNIIKNYLMSYGFLYIEPRAKERGCS